MKFVTFIMIYGRFSGGLLSCLSNSIRNCRWADLPRCGYRRNEIIGHQTGAESGSKRYET